MVEGSVEERAGDLPQLPHFDSVCSRRCLSAQLRGWPVQRRAGSFLVQDGDGPWVW
jgi:hypothetical protein